MRSLRNAALLAAVSCLVACARQVVEFPLDGGAGTGTGPGASGAPTVISTLPVNGGTGVALNSTVSATFNVSMDAATLNTATFKLKQGSAEVPGTVTYADATHTAIFSPAVPLGNSLPYSASISTAAQSSGVGLAGLYTWTFTTAASIDPPSVTATTPMDTATGVSINKRPTATFSRAMDPNTLTSATFMVTQGTTPVHGSVTLDGISNTATFTPDTPLGLGLDYTATVTTAAKDTGSNALAANYVWHFKTSACSQASVALASASGFVVLAGSTVTNTGQTSITGDVGVYPGTAITGFPPGTIVGAKHAGDPTAAQGVADLTTAYNDAAGRTLCPVSVSGNLGGLSLGPGLYKSTSSLAISSGDLTLDAQGDSDAIFIFQMASTLTTTSARKVLLANGTKPSNVFWQVGTSATLGTTSSFQGTIMANEAITLNTGASLVGRALARIAAVNLDSNTIVKPAP